MSDADLGYAGNIPESVRARITAARLLQQAAGQQTGPYTSKAVVGLKAIEGLMGGLQERNAINEAQQGQADQRRMMAQLLLNSASPGAVAAGGAAPVATPSTGAPGAVAGAGGASPSPISTASNNAFIQSALPHAQAVAAQTGIDPRLIVAQAALESNFGKSAPGGNLFGIKATGGQANTGPVATKEAVNGTLTPTLATFAAYGAPEASFAGYGKLMSNPRYAGVRNGATLDDQLTALGKSGYATDPNYAAKVGAIAKGIQLPSPSSSGATTASADMPAANAQPVASPTLPPGVDPSMLGPGAPSSPYGAMPTSMTQAPATPDAATLAAVLRGSAAGPGPGAAPLPATVQPSSPFGAMPTSMAQDPASMPAPAMSSAPPPSPQASPFGAPPQPMAPQGGVDPKMLAQLLAQGGGGAQPGSQSSPFGAGPQPMQAQGGPDQKALAAALLQRGAPIPAVGSSPPDPSMMQAGAPAPQTLPLSPNTLAMGDLAPGGPGAAALDPSGASMAPLPATGLSSGSLPGFDNITPGGQVQMSSIGDSGFTGSDGAQPGTIYNTPGGPQDGSIVTALQGNLPAPQQMAMGPSDLQAPPAPGGPSPAVMAAALRQSAPPAPTPGPTPASAPMSPVAPPPPAGVDQSAGPAPIAALGATPDPSDVAGNAMRAMQAAGMDTTGLPGVASKPATPPLPTMAGANVPPPDLSGLAGMTTPPAGSGLPIMQRASSNPPAALQQDFASLGQPQPQPVAAYSTEPTSRPGAQTARNLAAGVPTPPPRPSDAALGLDPDAPAPGSVAAGPAPLTNPMARALAQQPQPMGVTGNSAAVDPSSPQSFMRQEAVRAAGGVSPAMMGAALRGQAPGSAAMPQAAPQDSGGPLDGLARLFGVNSGSSQGQGGNPLASLPLVGSLFGGGQQSGAGPNGQAAGSSGFGGQGQGQAFTPGGQGTPAGQQAQGGQAGSAPVPGLGGMNQAQAMALLSNPYTTPQQAELIMSRLAPQPMKMEAGEGLVGRRPDGTYGSLYTQAPKAEWEYNAETGAITNKATGEQRQVGAAPRVLSPGQQLVGPNGVQAAVPATPHYEPVPNTGQAIDSTTGRPLALPAGAGSTFQTIKMNGLDVPLRITPDPNGGQPKIEMMTPGGGSAPAGQPGAPISFNGTPQDGAAAQGGPLGGIAPLVQQAGQMEAQNAAAKEGAVGQMKGANTFVEAAAKNGGEASNHVAELQQLKGLSAAAPTGFSADMARYAADHGLVTANGDAVKSYDGMRAYLGTQLRQAGSGALRNTEMDKLSDVLGSTDSSPAARAAAIQRIQDGYARQAAMGQVASDPTYATPMAKQARIQAMQQAYMNADDAADARPQDRALIIGGLQQQGIAPIGIGGAAPVAPPQSQGGGYLPGAAQSQGGPPTAAATPSQQQGQAPQASDAIAQAQAAIARGAPRAAVMQRLQSMGINAAGL